MKEFLEQVGINHVEEIQSLTNSVIGEPPPEGIDKVLYILTDALLLERQAAPDAAINKDLPNSNLLILVDRKETTPIPKGLPKDSYIELKVENPCYTELIYLLKRLTPTIKWKALTPQIHKEAKDIEKLPLETSSLPSELEQTPSFQLNDHLPIKLFSNKTLLPVVLIIVSVLLISIILFINNYNKPFSNKNSHPTSSSAIHSDLAIPMEPVLLDRPDLLNQISGKLKSPQDTQSIILVGIAGMGGVGKTTIARQFGHSYKASVVWEINAETYTTLISSFKDLAYELAVTNEKKKQLTFIENIDNEAEKKKQLLSFVKQHLRERPSWLLIYDNVDTFAAIKPYLPNDPKIWGYGKVIITTTDSNIKHTSSISSEQVIHIEELTEQECLTLFSKILYRKESSMLTSSQKEEALAFLKHIPPFPLDVSTAAYYIKNNHLSYHLYLERISHFNPGLDHSQQILLKEISDYAKTRYSVISSSLAKIIEDNEDFRDLLILICLLDSQNIPRSLLEFYKNPPLVDSFMHELKKYSFVTAEWTPLLPSRTGYAQHYTFSIHRSTQNLGVAFLNQIFNFEKDKSMLLSVATILVKYIEKADEKDDLSTLKMLISHCEKFLSHKSLPGESIGIIQSALGTIYYRFAHFISAEQMLTDSLANLNNHTPHNYTKIAGTLVNLGRTYKWTGAYEKAKSFLEKALLMYEQHCPNDHSAIGGALMQLGAVYRHLGDYEKAKNLFEESLSLYKKHFPESLLTIARGLLYLGTNYEKTGHYTTAKELLEQAFGIYKKCFSEDNHIFGWFLENLGNLYGKMGFYKEAKELFEQSLTIYKKHLPNDSALIGSLFARLGRLYASMEHYEEAKYYLEKALEISKKCLLENKANTAWILGHLGNVYREMKLYEKAQTLIEESLAIYKQCLPEQHDAIGFALAHLGNVYKNLGNYKKAKELLKQALSIIEKHCGKDHLKTAAVQKSMGEIYLQEGQMEESKASLKKALEVFQKNKRLEAYICLENLAEISLKKSAYAEQKGDKQCAQAFKKEAIAFLKQALDIIQIHCTKDCPNTVRIKSKLSKMT